MPTICGGAGGDATQDLYTAIENLTGSGGTDILSGDNGQNVLRGLSGRDVVMGHGGIDRLQGGGGNDTVRNVGVLRLAELDLLL